MSSLGTLTLDLIAEVGRFNQGLDQASRVADKNSKEIQKNLQKIDDKFNSLASGAKKLGAALGIGLSAAALNGWIHGAMQAASNTAVFASRIDVSVESLTMMRYVAEQAGVATDTFDSSMMRLTRRLGAAKNEGGPAIATLKRLGLSAEHLLSLPLDARLEAIGEAMKGLGTQAERLTAAQDLAGDSARHLVPMWMMQAKEINALKEEAKKLGYVYTDEMSQSADMVLGQIGKMKGAFNNLAFSIAGEFLPVIEDALSNITADDISAAINGFKVGIDYTIDAVKVLAVIMAGRFAASIYASALSFVAARIEAVRYQAALAQMAGVSRGAAIGITAMGSAAKLASFSMAALGGPVGILAIAASSLLIFGSSAKSAGVNIEDLDSKIYGLSTRIGKMTINQSESQILNFNDDIAALKGELEDLEYQHERAGKAHDELIKRLNSENMSPAKYQAISEKAKEWLETEIHLAGKIDNTKGKIELVTDAVDTLREHIGFLKESADSTTDAMVDSFNKMVNKLEDEIGRIGLDSNSAVFEYELRNTDIYKDFDINGPEVEKLRLLNRQKDARLEEYRLSQASNKSSQSKVNIESEYKKIMESTLTEEERRGRELTKNLDILRQYGASERDVLAVRRAAYESMSVSIPGMGEGGGSLTAQLARINENMNQLDSWRDQQLAKLEIAYGAEEMALAESLARKEEIENDYRNRRSQFEGEMNQEILSLSTGLTGDSLVALEAAGMKHNAIYKGMFLANKASAFANAIISSQEAGAKALAIMPGPSGIALSRMITGIGMANAGIIAATALQGFSSGGYTGHGGKYDPAGIVHKGEVVFSQEDIKRLGGVGAVESIRLGKAQPFFDGGVVGREPISKLGDSIRSISSGGDIYSSINVTFNGAGDVESRNENGGNQFAKIMESIVVSTMMKELKPGGILARR